MKAFRGSRVIALLVLNLGAGGAVHLIQITLTPWKNPGTVWIGWVWPGADLDGCGEENMCTRLIFELVCTYTRSRKLPISFVMSSSVSAGNDLTPTGRIFMKYGIWVLFRKYIVKIQVSLKSEKRNWYFAWRPVYIYIISPVFLEWEMLQTKLVEKIKIHTLCPLALFENRAVYEITWNAKPDKAQWQFNTVHAHCMPYT